MHKKTPPFQRDLQKLIVPHRKLVARRNRVDHTWRNGLFDRYQYPVLTAAHTPLFWRFDLNPATNPFLIERLGINAVFNPGAIELDGRIYLLCRVEGVDGKAFFAVAESRNPIERFRFWDYPITLPETDDPDINVCDMRLTQHADGWIYGLFRAERRQPAAHVGDTSNVPMRCGIVRTHDLRVWERLPDLKSDTAGQRDVVLHSELVDGQYALYTGPHDRNEIGWALTALMERAELSAGQIGEPNLCHAGKEAHDGAGAPPLKTPAGWLHIEHSVRATAAGPRHMLYAFLCDLEHPDRIIRRPGGYLLAPVGEERVGDLSNMVGCNGIVQRTNGEIYIYYSSSGARVHVARTTQEKLLDYLQNTPEAPLHSAACVQQRVDLIHRNLSFAPRMSRIAPARELQK